MTYSAVMARPTKRIPGVSSVAWRAVLAVAMTIAVLLLVSCASSPYPWRSGAGGGSNMPVHVVKRGETAYSISRSYGVALQELVRLNALRAPYTIHVGQRLRIPARGAPPASAERQTVTVERGDTVYALSRRYNSDVRSIISANRLSPPYVLRPGDRLVIPGAPVHVVARGETTYGISRRYGVDVSQLVRVNGLRPPYTIHVGQRLLVPGGGHATTTSPAPGAGQSAPARETAKAPAPPAAPRASLPPAPARSGFDWPLRGRIVSGFGPKDGGLHNDGINIAADRGAPVKASDAGVVAYAGSDLKAYGNLILIQHEGGWVTAYAHNERMLVTRGQKVGRGETIAHVGTTGSVTSPQLHFEIRNGRRAVNPVQHLPR